MIDKLKELENLENKYKEIGRINSEIESIIANIKNEAGISREKELLEENERLAKDLKAFHEKMKVREEEIGRLKNSNAVLIEELKEAKKVRRNGEIDKFQNILAEKMNVELESGVTRRLSNYAEEMKRKVKMLERNLSCEFSDEADSLRDELKKIDGEIGILKVSRFGDDTASLARKYASEFVEKGVKKVVLDLRNNPGGTVSAAQGLLGLWLDKQVAMTERRGSEIVKTINTTGSPILGNMKTVVLINGGSASASEIVAGALRDYDKAKLVGQKSYGKGSVQIVIGLPGGSQMKVTEARWYTPRGSNIDKTGIEPDVKVDLSADDINNNRDPQMDKAKSL